MFSSTITHFMMYIVRLYFQIVSLLMIKKLFQ